MKDNKTFSDSQHRDFDVEPWGENIEPEKLFEELIWAIADFIVTTKEAQIAIVLWLLHTFFIRPAKVPQLCTCSAILNISSPVRGCGKSTLREILELLSPRPISMSNASTSTIFRLIEQQQPTLFIDEADTFIENRSELIGILNESYKQTGKVYRQTGKNWDETKEFRTWCAKCIVGIGNLPDNLKSRCINIQLRRKLPTESIYRINERLEEDCKYFENIRRKIIRFIIQYEEQIIRTKVEINPKLDDRSQDNWNPLLKIAKFISEDIYQIAVTASESLTPSSKLSEDYGVKLLKDIQSVIDEKNLVRISTINLISILRGNKELPWDIYPKGGITPYYLASMLKPFDIYPKQYKDGQTPIRGYFKEDFNDAFKRYLS